MSIRQPCTGQPALPVSLCGPHARPCLCSSGGAWTMSLPSHGSGQGPGRREPCGSRLGYDGRGRSPDGISQPPRPSRSRSSPRQNDLPKTQSPLGHLPWLEIQNHQLPNVPKNNVPSLSPTSPCPEPRSFSHGCFHRVGHDRQPTWRGSFSPSDPLGGCSSAPPRWVSPLWRRGACPHHSHHASRSFLLHPPPGSGCG